MTALFRASAPRADQGNVLGALSDLVGTWVGHGFNSITLPDFANPSVDFQVKLNRMTETLKFEDIGAPIPNRGYGQADILLYGLTYLQQVNDAFSGAALHTETGCWLNVPGTSDPVAPPSVVRLSTIPHGDSLVAIGLAPQPVAGPPKIPSTTTFPAGQQRFGYAETILAAFEAANAGVKPTPVSKEALSNPNVLLNQPVLDDRRIVSTTTLTVSTAGGGGSLGSIPFVTANASATRMDATFWIETVEILGPQPRRYLQLQYSQTVLLKFPDLPNGKTGSNSLEWPHVTVATLIKR